MIDAFLNDDIDPSYRAKKSYDPCTVESNYNIYKQKITTLKERLRDAERLLRFSDEKAIEIYFDKYKDEK